MAATHRLHTTTHLPLPREEVFAFFADAGNLERITPPELNFRIVTPQPIEMQVGTLIDYELQLFGVGFRWRTEIETWRPPFLFSDMQLRGPYRLWWHMHTFLERTTPDGRPATRMDDRVFWQLPLAPVGELAYLLVRFQLEHIFAYRQRVMQELMGR
ncbi:MAG: SRPBCC family protein [Bacteroidota bacterium]